MRPSSDGKVPLSEFLSNFLRRGRAKGAANARQSPANARAGERHAQDAMVRNGGTEQAGGFIDTQYARSTLRRTAKATRRRRCGRGGSRDH